MKLPNGYGSVTKLSGNRRKPYLARVTLGWITDEQTGKTVQNRVPLGTFKTKKEALQDSLSTELILTIYKMPL